MRYRANERRIEIEATGAAVEEIVLRVHSLVVPHQARRLYFVPDADGPWPKLSELANQREDFKIIRRDVWPMNLCDRFRVMQDGRKLYIIPSDDAGFDESDIEQLAEQLTD
jgi:hypothetical protein